MKTIASCVLQHPLVKGANERNERGKIMLTMEEILNIVPAWRRIDYDTQLAKDPVYIDKVWIESKDGEITTLYDGVGTAGKDFIIRHTTTNKLAQVDLGLLFNDGLYIDVSSEMDQMYIKYRPLPG